nr:monocarboxylate transporter 3-like [Onthophagus taurus]
MQKNRGPPPQTATTSRARSTKSIPKEEENEAYVAIPPDGGWGWVVVLGAFYIFCIADGALVSFGIFLNDVSKAFNCTNSEIAIAGAVQTCCYCLAGPISAALVNTFGYRVVVILGTTLASIAYSLTALTQRLYQLIIAYGILSGLGFGMMYVSAVIAVGYYFERWRGLASGMSLCGAGIGATSLPPIITILLHEIGWRDTFYVISALILTCYLSGIVFRPLKPVKVRVDMHGAPKKTLSHISEVQETKSKMSQFFLHYNNATYPTVADVKSSVIALLKPPKVTVTRSASSEIIATTLLDGGEYIHPRSDADSSNKSTESCYNCCIRLKKCCYINCCMKCCHMRKSRTYIPSRPMYRDDIFYTGSIATLPEYKRSQVSRAASSKSKSVLEYHISVTRTTTHQDVEEEVVCKMCPEAVKRTLATMLDVRLLKNPSFLLLILNAFCVAYAFYTPFVYVKDRALENKFPKDKAFWLISSIGVMNTIGRVFCGILASVPNVKAHVVCVVFLFTAGVATILSGLSFEVWYQFTYTSLYGFCVSSISTLRSVIIVEILGLEKLTNAVGMILLFQGMATFAGTYISGVLRERTGSYHVTFYVSGTALMVGSMFLLLVKKRNTEEVINRT